MATRESCDACGVAVTANWVVYKAGSIPKVHRLALCTHHKNEHCFALMADRWLIKAIA